MLLAIHQLQSSPGQEFGAPPARGSHLQQGIHGLHEVVIHSQALQENCNGELLSKAAAQKTPKQPKNEAETLPPGRESLTLEAQDGDSIRSSPKSSRQRWHQTGLWEPTRFREMGSTAPTNPFFWESGVIKLCTLGKGLPGAPSGPPACSEGLTSPQTHPAPREWSSWKTNSACWIEYLCSLERGTRLGEHSRVPKQLQVTKTPRCHQAMNPAGSGAAPLGKSLSHRIFLDWKRPPGASSASSTPKPHPQCLKHFHGDFTTSLSNSSQC